MLLGGLLVGMAMVATLHVADRVWRELVQDRRPRLRTGRVAERVPRPRPGPVFAAPSYPLLAIAEAGHEPAQPKSGVPVLITARWEKGGAPTRPVVQVQVVEPGHYVRSGDAEFEDGWREWPLRDDGQGGDRAAGDGVFSAEVGAEVQVHRRLVRYRFRDVDTAGRVQAWPASTNACPNRAWWVYDGVPAWTGASRRGAGRAWSFSGEFMATLPAYHLLARKEDVERSQWQPAYNRQPFPGTFIADGRVYDHIQFHNRGQASTYVAGKNKWGFKFGPGQGFAARDAWGRPYRLPWKGFNLNACASPWAPVNRGMAGLDEAVSYRAYQLAGVPAPNTHWVQLRVVDDEEEAPATDPYGGDLWGLYLVVEEKNETWLKERGLPEGSIFSAESGPKYLAPGQPEAEAERQRFLIGPQGAAAESWWRAHLDVGRYTSFHAMNRVLANIDLREEGNHYLYLPPDGRWIVLPHDLDMMFIPKTHWPGVMAANGCLRAATIREEYRNRARDVLDLFCADASPRGGQVGQLVAEMAGMLAPAGFERNWAEVDEAMWNFHPRSHQRGQFYRTPASDQRFGGNWRRQLATPDFAGFCRYIVEFCTDARPGGDYAPNDGDQRGYGFGFLKTEADQGRAPARTAIRYRGREGYPVDALEFGLAGEARSAKGTIQWRVAEIAAPGVAGHQTGQPWRYELEAVGGTSGPGLAPGETWRVEPAVCQPGRTYRVWARVREADGRCGHWSEPVPFVAGAAGGRRP